MHEKDKAFLKNYSSDKFDKPSVAVDLLIYTLYEDELKILLVKRAESPFKDMLSLPGTFVGIEESLDDAVKRVLKAKAQIKEDIYFEQLYTWGDVNRDPRMRIISVSYMALVSAGTLENFNRDENISAMFYPVKDIIESDIEIAFDHKKIIEYGRERIKNKAEYMPIAFQFLEETFTLPQAQKVYEILLDKKLYKANFRKKISPLVEETEEFTSGAAHRPSRLYRRRYT